MTVRVRQFDKKNQELPHCVNPALQLKLSLKKAAKGTICPLQNLGKKLKRKHTRRVLVQYRNWKLYFIAHLKFILKSHYSHALLYMYILCSTKGGERTWQSLLCFSQMCKLYCAKATFTIAFFAAINHNYDHKRQTLKHRNTQNGLKSTNHKSQTMTFWAH